MVNVIMDNYIYDILFEFINVKSIWGMYNVNL